MTDHPYSQMESVPRVLMCATVAPGGISQLVSNIERSGFASRWRIEAIISHRPGSVVQRVATAVRALFRILIRLASGRIELVHLHAAMRGSFWRKAVFLGVARVAGKPVVLHLHGSEFKTFIENECGPLGQRLCRWVLSSAATVVVLSDSWGRYVRSIAPAARTVVLPNFAFVPWERTPDRDGRKGHLTCLFLGLLGPRKGVADLLEAVRQVRDEGVPLALDVGGNGDVDWFKDLVERLALEDCVTFHGWVAGDQKWELLEQADVFVLPSYNEGQPVAIVEAMGSGCAIISTKVGGIPEMLDGGRAGRLVEPGDVVALAACLRELAIDRNVCTGLGQAARQQYERQFAPAAVLPLWDKLYQQHIRHAGAMGFDDSDVDGPG